MSREGASQSLWLLVAQAGHEVSSCEPLRPCRPFLLRCEIESLR